MKIKLLTAAFALLASIVAMAQTPSEVVEKLRSQIAPDKRTAVWEVTATDSEVSGTVGTASQRDTIVQALAAAGVKADVNVAVLEEGVPAQSKWALVKLAIASLRTQGSHSSEMATQAIMGQPMKVLEVGDEWCRVQCHDDYIAYVPKSSIVFLDDEAFEAWRKTKRCIVTAYGTRLVDDAGSDNTVSDLVLGNILTVKGVLGDSLLVSTPDGREGWVEKSSVEDFDQWKKQELDVEKLERVARRMMGSGYLWGGTTTKVTDCSGLTKVCYLACGVILQRDASQQTLYGTKLTKEQWREARLGDLLFFGNAKGRVTHVGMYLRDGKYIHCSGQVKINSLDPEADDFIDNNFLSISRIDGMVGTKGITRVRDHKWY